MDYEPMLPSQMQPEGLRSTAKNIIYVIGGVGLVALIVVALVFWIIPMFNNASGVEEDPENPTNSTSQQTQYEQCLRSGGTASDCLKKLK